VYSGAFFASDAGVFVAAVELRGQVSDRRQQLRDLRRVRRDLRLEERLGALLGLHFGFFAFLLQERVDC
jgi:hypothetical protein